MKKRIFGMMLLAGALAFAQTTFKIQADRETCLYACGERATFTVTAVDSNGVPVKAGTVTASLDNFGPKKFGKRSVDLARENPFTVTGTLAEPGFLRLCLAGKGCKNQVFGVGYEPEKLEKGSPSPDDFDAFWADARAKLAREVPLDAQVVRVPERCTKDFDFFRISFATFGRRVYGYMSVPTDKARAPYPVDFQVAAAGFGGWTNNMQGQRDAISVFFSVYPFEPHWDWEKNGLKAKYDAMNAACRAKYGTGYAESGISESREAYFFYPVLLGIDRAVDWVVARPDVDRTRVRYQGTSQGGGFGFYLTGLNHAFTRAAFYVPAITDTMGYLKGRQSGWPQIVEHNSATPAKRAAAETFAPYFDGANFAARIRCPVRVAVGFADTTCAPGAVYAAYNAIPVKDKGIVHGIGMGHGCFGTFYQALGDWVRNDGRARAATVTLDLPKDGAAPVTAALQKAIDDLSSAGGGKLVLPAGTYLTGGIFLKDRVTLHLAKGATLLGSTNHLDYAGHKAVVGAVKARHVALEGEGTVDGRGWAAPVRDGAPNRWKCCFFFRCTDVRVEGVTLTNPASWTCYFKECDGVLARKVTIFSHANYNNDGFDIDSKNVLIEDCTVDSDDDAICPKSDNPNFVPENIEVRNCRLASNCNFIKFGTSSRGGFRNCRIHHCTLVPASRSNLRKWQHRLPGVTDPITGLAGIALEMVDGGVMENIRVHDIVMEGGMQTPVFVRLGRRNVHPSGARAELKNCVIENVMCRSTASFIASSITGVPGLRVQNLTLRNLDFTVKGGCTAEEATKRVPEVEKAYPENRMFAKLPLPAYGFYLRHADGIRFENVKLRFAGLREEREPVVQDDCTGVEFVNCDFRMPSNTPFVNKDKRSN